MNLFIPVAFSLGLFSSAHCLGMCGSISAVLSLHSGAQGQRRRSLLALLSNLGRVTSYGIAGAVAGSIGMTSNWFDRPEVIHLGLRVLGSLVLIMTGLYVAGLFSRFTRLDRLGAWLWPHIEPWGRRLLPVRNCRQAFAYGLVWGWLPCGLVYAALGWAATSGSTMQGMLTMVAFGLGTLPAVWATGVFAQALGQIWREPLARRYAGGMLILLGLITLALGPTLGPVHHHE